MSKEKLDELLKDLKDSKNDSERRLIIENAWNTLIDEELGLVREV